MAITLSPVGGDHLDKMRALYERSFPKDEKKPFGVMLEKQKEGVMEMLSLCRGEEFLGLVITAVYQDMVLVDYLAVEEHTRGQGVGGKAIRLIEERYPGKRIFLEVEEPNPAAPNQAERVRRLAFYERNGVNPVGVKIVLFGVDMILLSWGEHIAFSEYHAMYQSCFGPKVAAMARLRQEDA